MNYFTASNGGEDDRTFVVLFDMFIYSMRSIQPYHFQPKRHSPRLFQHFGFSLDHHDRSRSHWSPGVLHAPPGPVSTHNRASWPSVPTPKGRNGRAPSGGAPGGSAAPRGTLCCRSVTEAARSTPRPSFDPPCSRSVIRSDRARSDSDDASWRRSTGHGARWQRSQSASELR